MAENGWSRGHHIGKDTPNPERKILNVFFLICGMSDRYLCQWFLLCWFMAPPTVYKDSFSLYPSIYTSHQTIQTKPQHMKIEVGPCEKRKWKAAVGSTERDNKNECSQSKWCAWKKKEWNPCFIQILEIYNPQDGGLR